MDRSTRWGTRFGFYLAAVGSAFGLGNIWRFPYVVAENGGGAFVLLYLALVFLVGLPFLIGELMLGKTTGQAVVPAVTKLGARASDGGARSGGKKLNQWLARAGVFAVTLCVLVLAYYSVISGWVLHFLLRYVIAAAAPEMADPRLALSTLLNSGAVQIAFTSLHLLLVMGAVMRGFEVGIELWVSRIMPLFLVLVVALAIRSLSMDTATDAIRFLLYPDFSQLTLASLGRAIGQVCFTLSVGFGTMVTFGSYMVEKANVPVAGFRVAIIDSLVSIVAGLMIFPLVMTQSHVSAGPALLFQSVPVMFARESGGLWFGVLFFLSLYLAALGASIGLLETVVANLRQTSNWSRSRATLTATGVALFFSIVPAVGSSGVMEAFDGMLINWLLPVVALVLSQIVVSKIDREIQRSEFDEIHTAAVGRLYAHWRFAIRYIAPFLVVLGLVLQIRALF